MLNNGIFIARLNCCLILCLILWRDMQNHQNQVKRNCNLFFLLFSLLFLGNTAKGISFIEPYNYTNYSVERASGNSSLYAAPQNNNTGSGYVVLLFKKGIEGKGKLLTHKSNVSCSTIDNRFKDIALSNSGWIKHILTLYKVLVFPQEFISSFSFRGPPVLC